jgi:hypothetical protein
LKEGDAFDGSGLNKKASTTVDKKKPMHKTAMVRRTRRKTHRTVHESPIFILALEMIVSIHPSLDVHQ